MCLLFQENILPTTSNRRYSERFSTRKTVPFAVLFTQVKPAPYTDIIQQLGGCVVDKPQLGSVLICNEISRTFKFLFALARGIPIVTSKWLEQSAATSAFVSTEPFLTIDKKAEKRFKFSLKKSLGTFLFVFILNLFSVLTTDFNLSIH